MYLWFIAAFIAYLIKGLCGFANTLVFTSILSFGESNANISPVDLLLGYPMNLILVWKNRKKLDLKIYGPLAALVLVGSIPGALLLTPFAMLGLFTGMKFSNYLDEKLVRKFTSVMLVLSGIALILKNL